jgi:hypothetical protein
MNKADLSLLLMSVTELVDAFRPKPLVGTCDEMDAAVEVGNKCVARASRMMLFGREQTRAYKQCKRLMETIVNDEIENYFFGKQSSLTSHSDIDIAQFVDEVYIKFIEPMYASKYTAPRKVPLPLINLDCIVPVRRAKTQKSVKIMA